MSRRLARIPWPASCVWIGLAAWLLACSAGAPPDTLPRLTAADMDPALGYEPAPTLRASELFPAEVIRGPHHRVSERVTTDGFFRLYSIESEFGPFEVAGDIQLRQRVQEIRATAVMRELREGDALAAALRSAVGEPFVERWDLVGAPLDSVSGMPPKAWQQVLRIADMDPDARTPEQSALRRTVLEFEAAKRRLARRLAVNAYASNAPLQRELNRVAWAIAAGGYAPEAIPALSESSVAPLAEDVLSADRVEMILANDSPEDLRRRNRIELAVLGVGTEEAEAFLAHPAYSPLRITGVVESLVELEPARNCGSYVRVAMRARTPRDAFFRMMGALLLRFVHVEVTPIERLLVLNGRTPAAYTKRGQLIVAAQVDYLLWSRPVERFVRGLVSAEIPDLRIESRELWLSGEASPKARARIEAIGVKLVERVFETMVPRLAGETGPAH